MWAASLGHIDNAKLLVNGKADVNAQRDTGSTALMRAATKGNSNVAKFLIDNKADVKLTNRRGMTAADVAKENNHAETLGVIDPSQAPSG
jgi:ankyrin repeat protein